ncbi:MAG: dTMP kinase [Pseudomonadota bacterium]
MSRGRFITFEGGEGAGKTTQIAALAERLRVAGHRVTTTREPGGTPLAEKVRTLLLDPEATARTALTEALLFAAARSDHVAGLIRPALDGGAWVLSDRFHDSTRAYQGAADAVPGEMLDQLETMAVAGCVPDMTVLLDLPAVMGLERAAQRAAAAQVHGGPDRFEQRDEAYHGRLRDGFLARANAEPERFVVVDGAAGVAEISIRIWAAVRDRFEVA